MDGTAQIHDVKEGTKQWYDLTVLRYIRLLTHRHLSDLNNDESSQSVLYSVCFSPNSECLATAGHDRRIRVSYRLFAILSRLAIKYVPTFVTLQLFCNN